MEKLSLVDDGTLDTVFECPECRKEIRYSDIERDEDGRVSDAAIDDATDEHAAECEGPEDVSHATLASHYHSGQWSALYAFSSSGTVTEGLASEVSSALAIAEKNSAHWKEVQALKEFLEWAESEEAKKFPSCDEE